MAAAAFDATSILSFPESYAAIPAKIAVQITGFISDRIVIVACMILCMAHERVRKAEV